jgi:hypothetical protein
MTATEIQALEAAKVAQSKQADATDAYLERLINEALQRLREQGRLR